MNKFNIESIRRAEAAALEKLEKAQEEYANESGVLRLAVASELQRVRESAGLSLAAIGRIMKIKSARSSLWLAENPAKNSNGQSFGVEKGLEYLESYNKIALMMAEIPDHSGRGKQHHQQDETP